MRVKATKFIVISPAANETTPEYVCAFTLNAKNLVDNVSMKKIPGGTRKYKNVAIVECLRAMPSHDDYILIADDSLGNDTQELVEYLFAAGETMRVLCSKRPRFRYGVAVRRDMVQRVRGALLDTLALGEALAQRYVHHRDEFDLVASK